MAPEPEAPDLSALAAPDGGSASPGEEADDDPHRRQAWRVVVDPRRLSLGVIALLVMWSAGSVVGFIDPRILPAPWATVATAWDMTLSGRLPENMLVSLQRAGIGGAIGISVGLVLALIAGLSRLGESLVDGPVQINRAVPTLAFIPLAIAWFGVGELMKVLVIVLSVLVPIYINTHASLRGLERRYQELAKTVNLTRRDFVTKIAVPGALPGFFTGLRISVLLAWSALVVVEQINATSGIGYLMSQARLYGQIDIIVVGLAVYAVLGLGSDHLVRAVERRALAWRETMTY